MSRHTIEAIDAEQYKIAVGFDAALDSYFAQVIDKQIDREEEERANRIAAGEQEDDGTPERDAVVLWIGTNVREVTDCHALVEMLEPYAEVSLEVLATLVADREREQHKPSPLQQQMREFIKRSGEGNR